MTCPSHIVDPRRCLPAWVLRGALLLAVTAACVITMVGAPDWEAGSFLGLLLLGLALGTVLAPGSVIPLAFLIVIVLGRLATREAAVVDMPLVALLVILPTIHQLAALAAAIPAAARISWAVLRPSLIRLAAAIGGAGLIVALVAIVS